MDDDRPFQGEGAAPLLPLNYASRQLEATALVKTGDGILYGFTVTNTNAAAQYVLLFDSNTVPADGLVPILAMSVPAGDSRSLTWLPGRTCFSGIVLCNSSTPDTKTVGAADCLFDAQYA